MVSAESRAASLPMSVPPSAQTFHLNSLQSPEIPPVTVERAKLVMMLTWGGQSMAGGDGLASGAGRVGLDWCRYSCDLASGETPQWGARYQGRRGKC